MTAVDYSSLLNELRELFERHRTSAIVYVPRLYEALRRDGKSPSEARKIIEEDCQEVFWKKRTIRAALPDEAKNKKLYGLAAFHAQQALEMLIKACLLKYGFNDYLRTSVQEGKDEFYAEFTINAKMRGNPIMHHFPTGTVLRLAFDFIKLQVKKIGSKEDIDPQLQPVLEEMMNAIAAIMDLTQYVNEKWEAKIELWKKSISAPSDDTRINKDLDIILSATKNKLIERFTLVSIDFAQRKVREFLRMLEHGRYFKEMRYKLKMDMQETLERIGIPDYLAIIFFDSTPHDFLEAVNQYYGSQVGEWTVLTGLLAPGGMTEFVANKQKEYQSVLVVDQKRALSKVRYDFTWIPYLMSISYLAVFLYPHEQVGRYIQRLDKSGETTHDLYLHYSPGVQKLIEETRNACFILADIIDERPPSVSALSNIADRPS